jgi:hypothetical protein
VAWDTAVAAAAGDALGDAAATASATSNAADASVARSVAVATALATATAVATADNAATMELGGASSQCNSHQQQHATVATGGSAAKAVVARAMEAAPA